MAPSASSPLPDSPSFRLDLTPARSGLTGGILALRTPGSPMVLLPRTTFQMGSHQVEVQLAYEACRQEPLGGQCRQDLFENEMAIHPVTLSSYWIDRYEVTVEEYDRCVEARVCEAVPYHEGGMRFRAQPTFPVSLVNWNDAQTYCKFAGKRLPTEAEWERAARGPRSRRFPWGEHYAGRRANHGALAMDDTDASDGFATLAPVGSFPDGRTPEGLEDLAGNVSEWTADNYEDAYEALPVTDPKGPDFGGFKVVRGGSFVLPMPWLRAASRLYRPSSTRLPHLGFRCARDP